MDLETETRLIANNIATGVALKTLFAILSIEQAMTLSKQIDLEVIAFSNAPNANHPVQIETVKELKTFINMLRR
jgi:hypothetical protein